MRLWPKSLFGRLLLTLISVLLLAQLAALWIHLSDRARALHSALGVQSAQRIAGLVTVLEAEPANRQRQILRAMSSPQLRARLLPANSTLTESSREPPALMMLAALRRALGDQRAYRVTLVEDDAAPVAGPAGHRSMMQRHWRGFGPPGPRIGFRVMVQLRDGSWLSLHRSLPEQIFDWPVKLLSSIALLIVSVMLVSWWSVRRMTRPLNTLADAAARFGRDIDAPPVDIARNAPTEVRRSAEAFNTMQQRLQRYIEDRAGLLSAVSHDLKTPLTRLRLRAEMLDDEQARERFVNDIGEMEQMVSATLDFMRGIDTREPLQSVNLGDLLKQLQADYREAGPDFELTIETDGQLEGRPVALKRCLTNLLDNALRHGQRVEVRLSKTDDRLSVEICDDGPGIPEQELERIFEPFRRLDDSRNRDSGGNGLGLGIARNIARAHGGELQLVNRTPRGLCARLTLPAR